MRPLLNIGVRLLAMALVGEFAQAQPQFTELGVGLPGAGLGSVAWGDFDNDGFLDLAIGGSGAGGVWLVRVYRNDGNGRFTDSGASFPAAPLEVVAWGECDKDGRLDLITSGNNASSTPGTQLYRNVGGGGSATGSRVYWG